MTTTFEMRAAKIMRYPVFKKARADAELVSGAQAKAAALITEAEERAQAILAAAENEATHKVQALQHMSDDALARFLDERAVEQVAHAVQKFADAHEVLRSDFDATVPWMEQFAHTALRRMIGALPEGTVFGGIIDQSLAEVRERWDLVLRCHPSKQVALSQLIEATPKLSRAFREVQGDRALDEDAIWIVSAQGVLDCSIETQLSAILQLVKSSNPQDLTRE